MAKEKKRAVNRSAQFHFTDQTCAKGITRDNYMFNDANLKEPSGRRQTNKKKNRVEQRDS